MPYIVVEDFRAGPDARRSIVAGAPGSLHKIVNAHITRGGDVEKRKAIASVYSLPAGTFGAQAANGSIYVFGSIATPGGIPSGITYQRLQHPDGHAMTQIVMTKMIDGKVYALAKFSDGSSLPFYDGVLVDEWLNGVVRSTFTNNDGIAQHFADIINAGGKFTAVRAGNEVEVTGTNNNAFDATAETTNKTGGVNDQTITITQTQTAVPAVDEITASFSFRVTGGSSAGSGAINKIWVNGFDQLGGTPVAWATSNEVTAQAIATAINAYNVATAGQNWTATASGDTVTLKAEAGTGAARNNSTVSFEVAGDLTICTGGLVVTGGTSNPGVNRVTGITVNGVQVLGAVVNYTTDHSTTAAAIAAQINTYTSSPDYNAFANGPEVIISAKGGTDKVPNNLTVAVTVGGDVTVTPTAVTRTCSTPSGGRAGAAGQPQKTKLTFGGTFEAGDKFKVKLGDYIYGAERVAGETPTTILPLKDKAYVSAKSLLFFSGVSEPRKYNSDAIGAGFINMSSNSGGAEDIVGTGIYRNNVAAFTRQTVQIWFVDPDPTLNKLMQVLENVGAIAARSIESFGDSDVFFLSDTGIRSLRVRDTTENLNVYDVGTPVDDYVKEVMALLTDEQRSRAVGAIEPTDGRYMLAIGNKVFVFSYFAASKISAWSVYEPGFSISDFTILNGKLYARAGDTIYAYGGADGNTYDSCRVQATLPYLDAQTPATHKSWSGIDAVLEGDWEIYAGTDPEQPDTRELIAETSSVTLNRRAIGMVGYGSHIGLEFISEAPGPAKIAKAVVHYSAAEAG